MSKNIGQLRYQGKGYVSNISYTTKYQSVSSFGDSSNNSFKDLVIVPNQKLLKGRDYFIRLSIPRDMNYKTKINVKLIKKAEDNIGQVYQFLKSLDVSSGGDAESINSNVYQVALYQKRTQGNPKGEVAVAFPKEYRADIITEDGALYYRPKNIGGSQSGNNNDYFLGTGVKNGYVKTSDLNYLSIVASWLPSTTQYLEPFDIVFRPVEEGFEGILLEIVREPIDFDIQHSTSTGDIEYGRVLDPAQVKVILYELKNLFANTNSEAPLYPRGIERIGVWSHSGLLMAVNGEEIRVGPSGYYECDVVPITSLGIVAPDNDYSNNFTIDFTYDVTPIEEV